MLKQTIYANRTFLITDALGDAPGRHEFGLYVEDTRFLHLWKLMLDGEPPTRVSSFTAAADEGFHILMNPELSGARRGALSVVRRQLAGGGMHENVEIENFGGEPARFKLELWFEADFAHVLEVKHALEVSGEQAARDEDVHTSVRREEQQVWLEYEHEGTRRGAALSFSKPPDRLTENRVVFDVALGPRERWELCAHVHATAMRDRTSLDLRDGCSDRSPEGLLHERAERAAAYRAEARTVESNDAALVQVFNRGVRDLVSLRIHGEDISAGEFVVAAGIPWFMALFGRDTLITAYQSLPFFPDLARGALLVLARLQGKRVDPVSAEEPGKILHEHRAGMLAGARRFIPKFPYYGSVDATPLFVIVAHEYWRWTGDVDLVRELERAIRAALLWIDEYGDRDGDGYVEYRCESAIGLENQGWKDSHDAVRFRDGRIAVPPIALCEVQAYAYDAKRRGAELLDLLGDPAAAARLRAEAEALHRKFERDFWLEDRGTFAEALDGEKRKVDSITSNPGHVLWCGMASDEKASEVAQTLLDPASFSGFGVRTMASTEGGYHPLSYHNGSVWPHDNSLIAAGLARSGHPVAAAKVIRAQLDAAAHHPDKRLPELFAGFERSRFGAPVDYPAANRPQAWAAGAVLLHIRTMLGAEPDGRSGSVNLRPHLPPGVDSLVVRGLHVHGTIRAARAVREEGDSVRGEWIDPNDT